MAGLDYFYDGQITSYLRQIVSVFHSFQYEILDRNGNRVLRKVPAGYGNTSRMVAHIMSNNSENIMQSAPKISVYINTLDYDPTNRMNPTHAEKVQVSERAIDQSTGKYTQEQGNKYTLERLMPVPYKLTVNVDVWTTNHDQKHQLFEQIATIFNPDFDLTANTNPLDWSSLTRMTLVSNTYSSRSIPVGTDDQIDIMTFVFEIPIWINPPAKLKQQSVIHQVVMNIQENLGCLNEGQSYDNSNTLTRIIETPGNHCVNVNGSELTLLGPTGLEHDANDTTYSWKTLLEQYGNYQPNVTRFILKGDVHNLDDDTNDITGVVEMHPSLANTMYWTIDPESVPALTQDSVEKIVDPETMFPGGVLPTPSEGQRYLLISPITEPARWTGITANANDIIQLISGQWQVVFDAQNETEQQYVVNTYTNKMYKFSPSTKEWGHLIDGEYSPGAWRLQF